MPDDEDRTDGSAGLAGSADPAWDPYRAGCPCREVLSTISDKWALLILGALEEGPMRFNGLARRIEGVSPKMLAQTLRGLERLGLVARTAYPTVPVTVEYATTELGRSLEATLRPLRDWTVANSDALAKAQDAHDGRATVSRPARGSARA